MSEKPFVMTAKVMVRNPAGQYLFLRRSSASKHFKGKWEMPGGKMDPGEDLEECLVRETKEETGLDVRITHVLGAAEGEIPAYRLAYMIMEAVADSDAVLLSHEHDAFEWVPLVDASALDLCPAFVSFIDTQAERESHSDAHCGQR